MELKSHSKHVFTFEFNQKLAPGVYFPARTTIVKMEEKEVLIHSPGPFDEKTVTHIKTLGDRFTIIAPNLFHHFYLKDALSQFAPLTCYAPKKLASKIPDFKDMYHDLSTLPQGFLSQIDAHPIAGNSTLQEWVFFHKEDKVLICTDLIFNMRNVNLMTGIVLKVAGAHKTIAQSRLIKLTCNDRHKMRESFRTLAKFGAKKIIMAHGDIIEDAAQWQNFCETYR